MSKKLPIALQLYSVRDECAKDLPGVLEKVAKMGYNGIEFAGYYDFKARDLKKMLKDNGLACAGAHTGLPALQGDEFEKTMEFNQALENRYVIIPAVHPKKATTDAWKQYAEQFNVLMERMKQFNIWLGYHNHAQEFIAIDGDYPWDILFSELNEDIMMQVDTGNAGQAGVDVAPFIERYPGRAVTVHLKEWTDDPAGAVVGEGLVPWERTFNACETAGGTEWYIVEQEVYPFPSMECAQKCLDNLRAMGK